jgi:hypothetical protein
MLLGKEKKSKKNKKHGKKGRDSSESSSESSDSEDDYRSKIKDKKNRRRLSEDVVLKDILLFLSFEDIS